MRDRFYTRGVFAGREASFGKPLPSFRSITKSDAATLKQLMEANARFLAALNLYFERGGRA